MWCAGEVIRVPERQPPIGEYRARVDLPRVNVPGVDSGQPIDRQVEDAPQHDDQEQRGAAQEDYDRALHAICVDALIVLALAATLCLIARERTRSFL